MKTNTTCFHPFFLLTLHINQIIFLGIYMLQEEKLKKIEKLMTENRERVDFQGNQTISTTYERNHVFLAINFFAVFHVFTFISQIMTQVNGLSSVFAIYYSLFFITSIIGSITFLFWFINDEEFLYKHIKSYTESLSLLMIITLLLFSISAIASIITYPLAMMIDHFAFMPTQRFISLMNIVGQGLNFISLAGFFSYIMISKKNRNYKYSGKDNHDFDYQKEQDKLNASILEMVSSLDDYNLLKHYCELHQLSNIKKLFRDIEEMLTQKANADNFYELATRDLINKANKNNIELTND